MRLKGKHIVLGITGGIAAYKSAVLCRLLIKEGAEVKVVMTPNATEFITPVTMATLSKNSVLIDFFKHDDGSWNSHVDLGLWADAMLVAPATASSIGKMANGIADNLLITTYLSCKAPVFLAPAMDLDMMAHPSTQRNIKQLASYGNLIIEPESGELASGLEGKGRMAEPESIVNFLVDALDPKKKSLAGKTVLITAGPTYEKIDPVRFIGNFSTGKMGFALAEVLAEQGAEVVLIAGPVHLKCHHPNISRIDVQSAIEMQQKALEHFSNCDAAIMSAAVADYRVDQMANEKKKHDKNQSISIQLVPNPDIAASLGQIKKEGQVLVGFALETHNEQAHAQKKLIEKNLDFIVLNSLNTPGAGFGHDTNQITIIDSNGIEAFDLKSKTEVAQDIVRRIIRLLTQIKY